MDNNNAYEYEHFIKSVHHCVRFDVLGADADLYKWLEHFDALLQTEIEEQGALNYRNKEIEKLEYLLGRKTGEVATHLIIAIDLISVQFGRNLSYQDKEMLLDLKRVLKTAHINSITTILNKLKEFLIINQQPKN